MKHTRFTEQQILSILRQHESGVKISELSRQHGISDATVYNWKARYGGMTSSQLKRLKEMEDENHRLKKMYADLSLMHHALKDAVEKKL